MINAVLVYSIAAFTIPRIVVLCTGRVWGWRRAMYLIAMIVIVLAATLPRYAVAVQLAAMLFIPCGIKLVNRPRYYWLRQLVFLAGAISATYSEIP